MPILSHMKLESITNPWESTFFAEWQQLFKSLPEAPLFTAPWYQQAWWKNLGRDELTVFAVRADSGELTAVIPLFSEQKNSQATWQLIGTLDETDYLDILCARDLNHQVLELLLTEAAKTSADLFLACLPEGSPTLINMADLAAQQKTAFSQSQQTVCPVITLPSSIDEYENRLEKSIRQKLSKQIRLIEAEYKAEILENKNDLVDKSIEEFITLHEASGLDKQAFWTPERKNFFLSMGRAARAENALRLFTLYLDNDPAASLWIFDYHGEFFLYNSGFNAYRYGHLGVGNYLVKKTIDQAIAEKKSRYDFMRGNESYKFSFGAQAEPLYNLSVSQTRVATPLYSE